MSGLQDQKQYISSKAIILRPQATVFFDGGCDLCSKEIEHYRKIQGAEKIQWIDISKDVQGLAAFNLSWEAAVARFHVLDGNNKWHVGAWGFSEMWSYLSYYKWLSRGLKVLHLLPIVDRVYTYFARWRLRRRCSSRTCEQL